jgi:hypothetical protein
MIHNKIRYAQSVPEKAVKLSGFNIFVWEVDVLIDGDFFVITQFSGTST